MRLPPFPPEKKPPERASPAGTAGCGHDTVLRPCPATTRAERQIRGTAAHRALPPPSFPYWGKARSAERPSAPACAGLPRNAACTKEPRCPSALSGIPQCALPSRLRSFAESSPSPGIRFPSFRHLSSDFPRGARFGIALPPFPCPQEGKDSPAHPAGRSVADMRLPPFPPEKKPPERASPAGTAGCGHDTVLRPCPATTRAERQIRGTAAHRALPPPSFPYWGKARSAERPSAPACAGLPRNAACTKEPRCPSALSPAPTRAHRDAISPEGKLHNAPPSSPSLRPTRPFSPSSRTKPACGRQKGRFPSPSSPLSLRFPSAAPVFCRLLPFAPSSAIPIAGAWALPPPSDTCGRSGGSALFMQM